MIIYYLLNYFLSGWSYFLHTMFLNVRGLKRPVCCCSKGLLHNVYIRWWWDNYGVAYNLRLLTTSFVILVRVDHTYTHPTTRPYGFKWSLFQQHTSTWFFILQSLVSQLSKRLEKKSKSSGREPQNIKSIISPWPDHS